MDPDAVRSRPSLRTDLYNRDLSEVRVTDFFGAVAQIELT